MTMQATRHSQATGIFYQHLRGIGWQHLDTNDGKPRQVGPWYKTQAELLADHADYLQRAGWIRTA
jgi:hypothetical protein